MSTGHWIGEAPSPASFADLTRFDVIVYDRRGYQGSRDLAPVDLQHHIEDLEALVERESPPSRRHPLWSQLRRRRHLWAPPRASSSTSSLVVNYESPMSWVLPREGFRPPLGDDPRAEAERFFRRVMSDRAWERLSEPQRESRRLDGPALLIDLTAVRQRDVPADLSTFPVPFTYVYGSQAPYYRSLALKLAAVNPAIETVEIREADHAAHLRNSAALAQIIRERWERLCASV